MKKISFNHSPIKCKIFSHHHTRKNQLEKDINDWISDQEILQISEVKQTQCANSIVITFFYN